jgi:hypothetical protein
MSDYSITVNGTLNISAGTFNSSSDNNGFIVGDTGNLSMSGGTFSSEPNSDWLKEGYYAFANTDDDNTTYTISKGVKLVFTIDGSDGDNAITVKLNGKDTENDSGNTYIVKEDVAVAVTAPDASEGKQFAGWYDGNTLLSSKQTYRFTVSNDVEYKALYVANSETVNIENKISMLPPKTTTLNSKNALQFVTNRSILDDYTVVEAGILYADNSKLGISGMASTNLFTKKVSGTPGKEWVESRMKSGKCYTSKTTSTTGLMKDAKYELDVTVASATVVVYAIGYVKVKIQEENGEKEETIYTDVIATSYNSALSN